MTHLGGSDRDGHQPAQGPYFRNAAWVMPLGFESGIDAPPAHTDVPPGIHDNAFSSVLLPFASGTGTRCQWPPLSWYRYGLKLAAP
jgi:hypothetical protein